MLAANKLPENDCIRKLLQTGRSLGYIDSSEIYKCLPTELTDSNQIEDIFQLIEELGIIVKR